MSAKSTVATRNESRFCGAKTRSGGTCRAYSVRPGGRCAVHGGKSLSGPGHPNYTHGRRSRYSRLLSADAQDDFKEAIEAPDPLDLREEIALIRVFLTEALGSAVDVAALRRILNQASEASDAEDFPRVGLLVESALELLDASRPVDHAALTGLMNTLKGLVDTSGRILDIRANSFTRIQAVAMLSRVVELIATSVKDPADRKRVLTALSVFALTISPAHQAEATKLHQAKG